MRTILILCLIALCNQLSYATQITLVPEGKLHLNSSNSGRNYNDLVLHSILVSTNPGETLTVESLTIDLLSNGKVALSKFIPMERIVGETQGLAEMVAQGLEAFLNAQLLTEQGFSELLGRELEFSHSTTLQPDQVLLLTRQHFSLDFNPNELQVTVSGTNAAGKGEKLIAIAEIERYSSAISYTTPLNGAWFMTSLPSIQSHHRLNPPTEFSVDFFSVNEDGAIYEGDVLDATGFFGYGAEVLAAADGEVVFVIDDEIQDRAAYFPKANETPAQTAMRVSDHNMRRYAADFGRAAAGNLVTIRHQQDGKIEYSAYGHLKSGSVNVSVGDLVERGQKIAEVGDTGDSAAVHLHFQVNAGANVFASKSLPVTFSDLEPVLSGVDPGRFVRDK